MLSKLAPVGSEVEAAAYRDADAGLLRLERMALTQAYLVLLRTGIAHPVSGEPVYAPRPPTLWSVAQAMTRIRVLLDQAPPRTGLGHFLPVVPAHEPDRDLKARAALASTLVAGLELSREGHVALRQEDAFGTITVEEQH